MNCENLVSVIMPAYNAELFIKETIDSVLSQTYVHYEVIVVDDGSVDKTGQIVTAFTDKRIQLYSKENGGPAAARNYGIQKAKGMYLAFLDADDVWMPEKLSTDIGFLQKNPGVDMVCSACIRKHSDGKQEIKKTQITKESAISYNALFDKNIITTSTVVCIKEVIDSLGCFDVAPAIQGAEDYDLWLRVSDFHRIIYLDTPLVYYRIVWTGHNRSSVERTYSALLYLLNKQKNVSLKHGLTEDIVKKRELQLLKECGQKLFNRNEFKASRRYFLKVWRGGGYDLITLLYFMTSFFPVEIISFLRKLHKKEKVVNNHA